MPSLYAALACNFALFQFSSLSIRTAGNEANFGAVLDGGDGAVPGGGGGAVPGGGGGAVPGGGGGAVPGGGGGAVPDGGGGAVPDGRISVGGGSTEGGKSGKGVRYFA